MLTFLRSLGPAVLRLARSGLVPYRRPARRSSAQAGRSATSTGSRSTRPSVRRSISLAVNGLEHRLYPPIEALLRRLHRLAIHPCGRPLRKLKQILPHSIARLIRLIRRWLKAGVLEDGQVQPSEQGTPQGGSISVLLSNLYLHFVLDLWFERVVKRRLRGEARLVRYIDDFVICFQYRSDAIRVQEALRLRLGKFGLTLEPTKTKLVEFGRFAQRHAGKRGRKRPETIYFLGLTLYCTRNLKGNFKVGMRTEKSRLRRSLLSLQELMRQIRHYTIGDQVGEINAVLRGHYAYYGVAGNLRCLVKVYRAVERYWKRMLCSRSWAGRRLTWEKYNQIKARTPLLKPKLRLPYPELQALAVL